jgi:hypothetical protein
MDRNESEKDARQIAGRPLAAIRAHGHGFDDSHDPGKTTPITLLSISKVGPAGIALLTGALSGARRDRVAETMLAVAVTATSEGKTITDPGDTLLCLLANGQDHATQPRSRRMAHRKGLG